MTNCACACGTITSIDNSRTNIGLSVWDPTVGAENEAKQGKILVDAAQAEGIKHFVWSYVSPSAVFFCRAS